MAVDGTHKVKGPKKDDYHNGHGCSQSWMKACTSPENKRILALAVACGLEFELGFRLEFELGYGLELELGFRLEFELRFRLEFELGYGLVLRFE